VCEVAVADTGGDALGRGAAAGRARAAAGRLALAVIAALEVQLDAVDGELRRFARADARCQALQSIYGIGPILACHLLAEIGEACRFRRSKQITRLAGLDPVVDESGETRRRGHLAKAGSPQLRWALVEAAVHANRPNAPDLELYEAVRDRRDTTVARLSVARKIGKRAYHVLRELELAAA
jgi:transposase